MPIRRCSRTLWNQNITKYCVKVKGTQKFLLESWTNYHLRNNQWVYEYFTPDGDGFYDLRQPLDTYSIDHLLFQWNTAGVPTGIQDIEIDFVNQAGTVANAQTLRLMIDNNLPDVQLLEIQYKNKTVNPCDIVSIDTSADPVKVHYRAFDAEGDVYCYGMDAYHGQGKHDQLIPQTIPADGQEWQMPGCLRRSIQNSRRRHALMNFAYGRMQISKRILLRGLYRGDRACDLTVPASTSVPCPFRQPCIPDGVEDARRTNREDRWVRSNLLSAGRLTSRPVSEKPIGFPAPGAFIRINHCDQVGGQRTPRKLSSFSCSWRPI